jgi:enamine deaminase RidA (YjgF/YER057c/UK114 family)
VVQVDPAKFPWLDVSRYTFSMAVESQGVVYISGQTAGAYDSGEGKVVCKGGLVEQTRLIYEKLGVILEAAGLGFQNVVKTVDYLDPVALPHYRQTAAVRREYLQGPVASTGVCVQRLLRRDALIEISAVAVTGDKRLVGSEGHDRNLTFAPAVESGDIVWLSGLVGHEVVAGQDYYPQDTRAQSMLAYRTVESVLEAAGVGSGDIVDCLQYVDPQAFLSYPDSAGVRREFFRDVLPAVSEVVVNRLLRPEGHMELEAVAVKGDERQQIVLPEWQAQYDLGNAVPATKKGRLLHVSGQISVDHGTGEHVGGFDVAAQAEQAYRNVSQILAAAGYSLDDVVNTTEWVAPNGLMGYRDVQEVRRRLFGRDFPSATGVMAHRFARPESLFQVTAVAVV